MRHPNATQRFEGRISTPTTGHSLLITDQAFRCTFAANNAMNHWCYSSIRAIRDFHTDLLKARFYSVPGLETTPKLHQNYTENALGSHSKSRSSGKMGRMMRL